MELQVGMDKVDVKPSPPSARRVHRDGRCNAFMRRHRHSVSSLESTTSSINLRYDAFSNEIARSNSNAISSIRYARREKELAKARVLSITNH